MPSTNDPITAFAFPNPKLTSLLGPNGKPSRLQLLEIQRELNANAMSVSSTVSFEWGLLALTTDPIECAELNDGEPFFAPVKPPAIIVYREDSTELQQKEIKEAHAVQNKAYKDCMTVDRALLRQLRDACPPA
jgi:hypothetical protein